MVVRIVPWSWRRSSERQRISCDVQLLVMVVLVVRGRSRGRRRPLLVEAGGQRVRHAEVDVADDVAEELLTVLVVVVFWAVVAWLGGA